MTTLNLHLPHWLWPSRPLQPLTMNPTAAFLILEHHLLISLDPHKIFKKTLASLPSYKCENQRPQSLCSWLFYYDNNIKNSNRKYLENYSNKYLRGFYRPAAKCFVHITFTIIIWHTNRFTSFFKGWHWDSEKLRNLSQISKMITVRPGTQSLGVGLKVYDLNNLFWTIVSWIKETR
jgi:hypothetical protein